MLKLDLHEGEQVRQIYRQSEAVLFKPVLVVFVLIYFPWYFLLTSGLAADYVRFLLLWTGAVFFYAAYNYIIWLLNIYLLTDRRLVCINYFGLFSKKVLETPLGKILNVGFSSNGFWQTVFKFGTVQVQVPGLLEPLSLKNVGNPAKIKDALWHAHALDAVRLERR
ncbi:MAG: PH domain-containing protein [Candidatus Doudnabacteria bacterium]|nr:PH domain-containing protein [Candidatus Doudnabacteria bacterium]